MAIQKTSSMLERIGGSIQLLAQITEVFLQSWKQEFGSLQAALKSGDRVQLARSTRSLRVSLGYFGNESILSLFLKLEDAVKQEEHSATLHYAKEIEPELGTLAKELEALHATLSRRVAS